MLSNRDVKNNKQQKNPVSFCLRCSKLIEQQLENLFTMSSSFLRSEGFSRFSVELLRKQAFLLDNRCMTMFCFNRKGTKK